MIISIQITYRKVGILVSYTHPHPHRYIFVSVCVFNYPHLQMRKLRQRVCKNIVE